VYLGRKITCVDLGEEEVFGQEGVLLNVAFVVVVGAVFLGLKVVGVFDHFAVESVENGVRDKVLDDHKTIAVKSADGSLKIDLRELSVLDFLGRRFNRKWLRGERHGGKMSEASRISDVINSLWKTRSTVCEYL
jgi:hypothetical protein